MTVFSLRDVRMRLTHRLRFLTPERLFWGAMVALAAFFLFMLALEPTGAGRGGR